MIGIIKRPNMRNAQPSFDPLQYFDSNDTCTEADFITILEHGCYDRNLIGKFVTLSNTVDYNGGKWIIADVNHDSENTGQSNCYDLISVDCFHSAPFGNNQYWRDSDARTWLSNTFYGGFKSNFKAHIINPKYNSDNTWYTDDKIILPSFIELNGNIPTEYGIVSEDVKYPIFTGNDSRIKYDSNSWRAWWTRSRATNDSNRVWDVAANGSMGRNVYDRSFRLAPLMRVQ